MAKGDTQPRPNAAACGLTVLPEETVVRILSLLTPKERFKTVSLVCTRFRQLCLAPELLRSLALASVGEHALDRCIGLRDFLSQHAQHVRRLTLHVCIEEVKEEEDDEEDVAQLVQEANAQQQAELQGLVLQCLQACSAAARLEELVLSAATQVGSTAAWLAGLTSLSLLWLGNEDDDLQLPEDMSGFTALRELGLRGKSVRLPTFPGCLPTSLTRLHLAGAGAADMLPQQLPRLPSLGALELLDSRLEQGSLAGLTLLTGLHTLQLDGVDELPACLPALTQLRQLELHNSRLLGEGELGAVHAALCALRGLTCLVLGCFPVQLIPPAVGQLALHRLLFFTTELRADPVGAPHGPWLSSLSWLGLPFDVAQRSVGVLRSAHRLRYLALIDVPILEDRQGGPPGEEEEALWAGFWEWAATHTPLACLGLDMDTPEEGELTMPLLDALVALARRRPALCIRRTPAAAGADSLAWCRSSVRARQDFFFFWEELANGADMPGWGRS